MADFVRLAVTAKRLIEKNGRTLLFYKRERTAANPAQPWRGATAATPDGSGVSILGCVVPASGSGFGRQRSVDGTSADTFEQVALIAANSVPAGADLESFSSVVDTDSRAWKIDGVEKMQPADVPLVFVVRLST